MSIGCLTSITDYRAIETYPHGAGQVISTGLTSITDYRAIETCIYSRPDRARQGLTSITDYRAIETVMRDAVEDGVAASPV